jgi:hypothetical protein
VTKATVALPAADILAIAITGVVDSQMQQERETGSPSG